MIVVGSINADATDSVIIAVEDTTEFILGIADSGVVALIWAEICGAVCDVVAQLEECIFETVGGVAMGSVHVLGEEVETSGAGNNIWMFL